MLTRRLILHRMYVPPSLSLTPTESVAQDDAVDRRLVARRGVVPREPHARAAPDARERRDVHRLQNHAAGSMHDDKKRLSARE